MLPRFFMVVFGVLAEDQQKMVSSMSGEEAGLLGIEG